MPYADPIKRRANERERKRRYRARQRVKKYGPQAEHMDMRGRHGNHVRGSDHPRWNGGRMLTSHGYVMVRVEPDHPHAWGPPGLKGYRYAYEHVLVAMEMLGRPLKATEVVHHRNGDKTDNRSQNLEITTVSKHSRHHANHPNARDREGRFRAGAPRHGKPSEWPEDLRVRQWPEVARG